METFIVEVRMAISGDEVCSLELPAAATLAQLRERIAEKDGREAAQQTLLSGTTELCGDRKTLRELFLVMDVPDPNAVDSGDAPSEGARTVEVQLIIRPLEAIVKEVREMRHRLSDEQPDLQAAVDKGVVEKYGIYLSPCSNHELQLEAAWALTNIASGSTEHVRALIENGLVPRFVELLRSQNQEIAEQAVWGLANIAGDCAEFRDEVLKAGAMEVLMTEYAERHPRYLTRTAPWALGNMCRGEPAPSLDLLEPIFRKRNLYQLLSYSDDAEVIQEFCWACNYISDYAPDVLIHRLELAPKLCELCFHDSADVQEPSVGTIAKLAAAGEAHVQAIVDANFLAAIPVLVGKDADSVREKAFTAFSEIAAKGSAQHLQGLLSIDSREIHRIVRDASKNVRMEARKAISKLLSSSRSTSGQLIAMVQVGYLEDLMYALQHWDEEDGPGSDDNDVLSNVLNALLRLVNRIEELKDCKLGGEAAGNAVYIEAACALFSSDVEEKLEDMESELALPKVVETHAAWKVAKAHCSAELPSS